MGRVILVRHGESTGNRDRIFALDAHALPLTALGYTQAEAAARVIGRLFRPVLVAASPYVRARETARVIAECNHLPLQVEPDLYEREVGALRGRSYDALQGSAGYEQALHWRWRPERGESYEDVQARTVPVLERLVREYPDGDVVLVSHGGVMLTLWAHAAGRWEGAYVAPNCGMVLLEHHAGGFIAPCVVGTDGEVRDTGA